MNIFIIYPYLIFEGIRHGSGKRLLRLISNLSRRGHNLFVLSLAEIDPSNLSVNIEAISNTCEQLVVIPRPKLSTLKKTIHFLMPGVPSHVRNLIDPRAQAYVRELTQSGKIDLVYLVFTATGEYLNCVDRTKCAVILDSDDLETRRYAIALSQPDNLVNKIHNKITYLRERKYEKRLLGKVDRIISISEEEKHSIQRLVPNALVEVVPIATDTQKYHVIEEPGEGGELLFIGSFTHQPNIGAIEWFTQEVFPTIQSKYPKAHLNIIGADGEKAVGHLAYPGIDVVGWVEDINPWIEKASVVICPVRTGGGARMKNLEALASGRPVVTTSLGAEGLGGKAGSGYFIADSPVDFANTILQLWDTTDNLIKAGHSARAIAEQFHDIQAISNQLEDIFTTEVSSKRSKYH